MAKFIISGGKRLSGTVAVSGAKNAALPIMAASLMAEGETILENVPQIEDVKCMAQILEGLGASVSWTDSNTVSIKVGSDVGTITPYPLAKKLRASNLLLGSLAGRFGRAEISMPGGCSIGSRPMDLHLKGLKAMGGDVTTGHGFIKVQGKLHGEKIYLDFPSVGATENLMMAAALSEGQTVLENAAKEPEIVDLANFLNAMGAQIWGAGTDLIRIRGVRELRPVRYSIIPDRIEAGTLAIGAAVTGGRVRLENVIPMHLMPLIAKLKEAGARLILEEDALEVEGVAEYTHTDIKTMPYPGFPTDLQSPMLVLLSRAKGTSVVVENIYENRFRMVGELRRMGANIRVEGQTAVVVGVEKLYGAQTKATDLRAGAALVLAALAAEGQSEVCGIEHVDRGYEDFHKKLLSLGADIERVDA
ncbi:MAG TPA: UDP-N-acetylglucosamine 1-carboxyvinyltransferase [Clostridia bacterium]|nr:UDP-N-acetylglucosamine 1-carboxyvinyltransferase [Clostridia bacterium]